MNKFDVTAALGKAAATNPEERGISSMAQKLVGSEILKIAAEVRGRIGAGDDILNLSLIHI